MGHLPQYDGCKIYRTVQAASSQYGLGGINLAPTHGKVHLVGDEEIS